MIYDMGVGHRDTNSMVSGTGRVGNWRGSAVSAGCRTRRRFPGGDSGSPASESTPVRPCRLHGLSISKCLRYAARRPALVSTPWRDRV